jgi:hypothetical protein
MTLHYGYAKAMQDEMIRQAERSSPTRRASKEPIDLQSRRLVSFLITGTAFLSGMGLGWIVG